MMTRPRLRRHHRLRLQEPLDPRRVSFSLLDQGGSSQTPSYLHSLCFRSRARSFLIIGQILYHRSRDHALSLLPFTRFPSSGKRSVDPLPWNDYFDKELYLKNQKGHESITHHVYVLSPIENGPLLITHHGAGSSGLSFALFASELRKLLPRCGVLSLDARGHGETIVEACESHSEDDKILLTLDVLSQDLFDVIRKTQEEMKWSHAADVVLIGHSLGGAVVTDLAMSGKLGKAVLGYAVLDVVEGSAMDALQSMQQYLLKRPSDFSTMQSAIEWQ